MFGTTKTFMECLSCNLDDDVSAGSWFEDEQSIAATTFKSSIAVVPTHSVG